MVYSWRSNPAPVCKEESVKIVDNRKPLPALGTGEPYKIQFAADGPAFEAHVSHFVKLLVKQTPVDTMADVDHGLKVLELVNNDDAPPERLEFEDADYAWLVKKADSTAPRIFGLMARRFRDALELMSVADKKAARNGKKSDPVPEEEPAKA